MKTFVILYNVYGCELSCDQVKDMDEAKSFIITDIIPHLELGDTVSIKEMVA